MICFLKATSFTVWSIPSLTLFSAAQVNVGHYQSWRALLWRVRACSCLTAVAAGRGAEASFHYHSYCPSPFGLFFYVPEIRHRGGFCWLLIAQQNLVPPTAHTAQKEESVHARQSTENSGRTFITYWTTSYLGKIWRLCISFQCFLSSGLLFFFFFFLFFLMPSLLMVYAGWKNSASFALYQSGSEVCRGVWGLFKWQSISDLKTRKHLRPFEQVMLLYTSNPLCLPEEILHKQIWLHAKGTFFCACKLAFTSW